MPATTFVQTVSRRIRWYWGIAIALAIAVIPVAVVGAFFWQELPRPWLIALRIVGTFQFLALVVWAVGVAPYLSAGDVDPGWTAPPRYHLNTLRLAVWAPAIALMVSALVMDVWPMTLAWLEGRGVHGRFQMFMFVVAAPGVAGAVAYGVFMSRRLARRFHETTRRRRICFDCGFDLAHSPTGLTRCPECGRAVESANDHADR